MAKYLRGMAANETRQRIVDTAELLFAEKGYTGASIRCITAEAAVDLGAVRYHFGSKDALFGEVMTRRLVPLNEERVRLLDELELRYGDECPPVEEISRAFLMPVIRLVLHETYGRAWMKLLGRVRVEPGEYLEGVQKSYSTMLSRYLTALAHALPELPKDEITYRFYFLFGTEVNTIIDDGTLRAMGGGVPDLRQDPDGVCERLIQFVTAGMTARPPKTKRSPFGAPARPRANNPPSHTRFG